MAKPLEGRSALITAPNSISTVFCSAVAVLSAAETTVAAAGACGAYRSRFVANLLLTGRRFHSRAAKMAAPSNPASWLRIAVTGVADSQVSRSSSPS
jgi:hypothetical protein